VGRVYEQIERETMTEQYYLHLFHARQTPSELVKDTDYRGPLFRLAGSVRSTYGRWIRFQEGATGAPYQQATKDCSLQAVGDCVYYDGVYYGEWCVRTANGLTLGAPDYPVIQFDPTKSVPPRAAFVVDRVPDANGHWTIRTGDGSPNGDTGAQPVATFYDRALAKQVARSLSSGGLGPVAPPAKLSQRFVVTVQREAARSVDVEVEAASPDGAARLALERAGDIDFSNGREGAPSYHVATVKALGSPAETPRAGAPGGWVNTRGLDAETVAEVSSLMFGDGLAAYFETQAERLNLVYSVVRAFQEAHENTDWAEHGDYWGAIEAHCAEAMKSLRKTHKPLRPALSPVGYGPGEYAVLVRFVRNLADDLDVLAAGRDRDGTLEDRLQRQFIKELQAAYDENNIAGDFFVREIQLPPAEERHTQEEWRAEVAAGDTRLGYDEWLLHRLEQEGR
jgi:hypothetical protein